MKKIIIISLIVFNNVISYSQNCVAGYIYSTDSTGLVSFIDTSVSVTGNVNSWFWDFSDGTSSNLQFASHQFNFSGSYFVCLTITTDDSCTDTHCVNIDINLFPNPCDSFLLTYNIVNASGPIQSDGSITTQVSGGTPPYNYMWSNNDSTSVISNLNVGSYCVTVTDANMCMIVQCMNVVTDTSLYFCYASFSIIPSYCPNCYGFFDNSTASGNIISWAWNFSDGNISTQQNTEHTFLDSGMYYICLSTITDQGCADTICDSVFAQYNLITYSISGEVAANGIFLSNGTAELYDTNLPESHPPLYSQNIVSGIYSFPDVVAGTYKLLAIPDPPASQYFASTFFGNTTDYNNAYVLSVYYDLISVDIGLQPNSNEVNNFSEYNCSIFPNPVDDILNISLNSKYYGAIQIVIMDFTGKIVLNPVISKTNSNGLINIDLSSLDDGLYLISILHNNLKSTDKLIIRK